MVRLALPTPAKNGEPDDPLTSADSLSAPAPPGATAGSRQPGLGYLAGDALNAAAAALAMAGTALGRHGQLCGAADRLVYFGFGMSLILNHFWDSLWSPLVVLWGNIKFRTTTKFPAYFKKKQKKPYTAGAYVSLLSLLEVGIRVSWVGPISLVSQYPEGEKGKQGIYEGALIY